jgi:hypothetical protein
MMICVWFGCIWAQDERPAVLHMAQPKLPVSWLLVGGTAPTGVVPHFDEAIW